MARRTAEPDQNPAAPGPRSRLLRVLSRRSNAPARTDDLLRQFRLTRASFDVVFDSCQSLPDRLRVLADTANAHAGSLAALADSGIRFDPQPLAPDWAAPWELHRNSPRVPIIEWQQLDRALDGLGAVLDTSRDPLEHAASYEQVATAARCVADGLESSEQQFNSQLGRCAFCGKRGHQVTQLITSQLSSICNECVSTCLEILDREE